MNLITLLPLLMASAVVVSVYTVVRKQRKRGRYSPFTSDFLREPGETLRGIHQKLVLDLFEKAVQMIIVALVTGVVVRGLPVTAAAIVVIFSLLIFLYFLWKFHEIFNQLKKTMLGLEGEVATGQELTLLMHDGAWVFHDIPYQYGNIDHIIISAGGVFAVETKAVSKPQSVTSSRSDWKVEYDGKTLQFPHYRNTSAIEQSRRHAKHLFSHFKKKLGIHVVVTPVVALPGWFINRTGRSDVWVINPKERSDIRNTISKNVLSVAEVSRIAADIESVARSVRPGSKRFDPDASDHYDFWNNPRYKPPSVD